MSNNNNKASGAKKKTPKAIEPYGDQLAFCEPSWYQGESGLQA